MEGCCGGNSESENKRERECCGQKKRVLVTFDIDGTLIQTTGPASNRLHRRAFTHAFLDIFGIDCSIDVVQVATEKLPDLKSKMVEFAKEHAEDVGEGLQLLPGVATLLQALSLQENVAVGLVTGNLEEIAWIKMDGLGIRMYFTVPNFGGFGSDHTDRGELVKIAAERAEKIYPGGFDLRVHVGDTPNDIKAAEFGGALPLGVCTGVFTKEELEKASCGNAIIFPDLADTKALMSLMGIEN